MRYVFGPPVAREGHEAISQFTVLAFALGLERGLHVGQIRLGLPAVDERTHLQHPFFTVPSGG